MGDISMSIASAVTSASPVRRAEKPAGAVRAPAQSWLQRLTGRREPTLYQRCLALHIATASRCDSDSTA
jgi:hypothetical protein